MRRAERDDLATRVAARLRDVPDFPQAGVLFKDITPLLADPLLFREVTEAMADPFRDAGVTHVAAIESRGFILGAPVAQSLGAGLVPLRKPGKLPWRTVRREYALEYGTDALEMHADAIFAGTRVLIVDDVLATGGTALAACELVEGAGGEVVGCSFLMGIRVLRGGDRLGHRLVARLADV